MRTLARNILILVAAGTLLAGGRAAAQGDSGLTKPPVGSVSRQLRLQTKLRAAAEGVSLADALRHNREQWDGTPPEQRDQIRSAVWAFRNADPKLQNVLIKRFEAFIEKSHEERERWRSRARWLKKVVSTFTADEREALKKMSPDGRARKILARRDEMVAKGTLVLDAPTTRPPGPDASD